MPSSLASLSRSALASSSAASGQTRLSNAMRSPSGLQRGFEAPVDRSVIWTASPGPVMSMTKICGGSSSPPRLALNAILAPSGRQRTPLSPPAVAVSRRGGALPSTVISHRSETVPSSS